MANFQRVEFKMAAIIKLSQNEWVKIFFECKNGHEFNMAEFQDGCHHRFELEMKEWSFFVQMVGPNLG